MLRKILNTKDKMATVFAVLEKFLELIINFLINYIVLRMLSVESYAVITVVAGYATIVGFLNIAPENHLFKIFHSLTTEQLEKKMKGYISFNIFKAILVEMVYVLIGLYLANSTHNSQYILYTVFFGICQIEEIFWQMFRMTLELRYQQKKLVIITIIVRFTKLSLFLLLFQLHSLLVYVLVNVTMTFLEILVGIFYFYGKNVLKKMQGIKNFKWKEIKESLTQFAVLNHISGVLNSIIYSSDTIFLELFVTQTEIGHYGIVLGGLNYINLIFQVLQKQVSIALGNSGEIEKNHNTVSKFMMLSVGGSIVVVLTYLVIGKWALKFYAGDAYIDDMYFWGIFILLGTSIFNAIRPMFAFVIYKGDLKRYLAKVLVPIFVIMVLSYYLSSRFWGVIGIAFANTIVYGIWGISIIYSYYKIKRGSIVQNDNDG